MLGFGESLIALYEGRQWDNLEREREREFYLVFNKVINLLLGFGFVPVGSVDLSYLRHSCPYLLQYFTYTDTVKQMKCDICISFSINLN